MSKTEMLQKVRNGQGLGRVLDKLNSVLRAFKQAELDLKQKFARQAQDIERLKALLVENGVDIAEQPTDTDVQEKKAIKAQAAMSDLRNLTNFSTN